MSLVSRLGRVRELAGTTRRRLRLATPTELRVEELDRRLATVEQWLHESWETTTESLQRLEHRVARTQQVQGLETVALNPLELRNVLWAIATEEPEMRRRVWALRDEPDYELAYTEAEPLVSIVIPTRDRPGLLTERSLPSALAQTHPNVEVIVVGDTAGPEIGEAIGAVGDDRVRYRNLTHRVVASDDERKHWLVAATMMRNEGARMARGRWLVSLDDDDAMYPDQIERLLALARETRAEVVYGKVRELRSDGRPAGERGEFPPRAGEFNWQAALYHGALRVFERHFTAAEFATPGDWYMLERMLRTGVRFAMLDELVCDYFPSQS